MTFDNLLLYTLQSSLVLGLLHGISPCGHSWLILAPFVAGETKGGRVAGLTFSFLAGTTISCVLIGMSLGTLSGIIPASMIKWLEYGTTTLIVFLGTAMIIKPELLHNHDHEHNHDPDHEHNACGCNANHTHNTIFTRLKKNLTVKTIFVIGFLNMIIPCPTVSIMYKYAIESGNYIKSTLVFTIYAVATAIAVSMVIFAIYKVTSLLYSLQKAWIEKTIMRTAGVVTILFGIMSAVQQGWI